MIQAHLFFIDVSLLPFVGHFSNLLNHLYQQTDYFVILSKFLFVLLFILPLIVGGITAVSIWHAGKFWQKLGIMALLAGLIALINWGVLVFLDQYYWAVEDIFSIVLYIIVTVGFLGLLLIAIRNKDTALGLLLGLFLLFIPLAEATSKVSGKTIFYPNPMFITVILLAFLFLPLSFTLHSARFLSEKRWGAMLMAFFIALSILIIPAMIFFLPISIAMSPIGE